MGLRRELGSVEPGDQRPPDRRAGEIELGTSTLAPARLQARSGVWVYGRCLLDGVPQPGMRIARPRIRPWRRSSIASLAASKG